MKALEFGGSYSKILNYCSVTHIQRRHICPIFDLMFLNTLHIKIDLLHGLLAKLELFFVLA